MLCPTEKLVLLLLVLALLAAKPVFAEENVTELRIESITTPIEAGGRLLFSFSAGNKAGPECSAQIQYWFEEEGEKSVQGSDNFYLETGETISKDISLIVPSGLQGVKTLYLEMRCNQSTILASRVIEITGTFPAMPQFDTLHIEKSEEGSQLEFTYTVQSNTDGKVAIWIEEQIEQDNNVVWINTQNIAISGSSQIERFGPMLPLGNYRLIVEAHGSETARIIREFTVSPMPIAILPTVAIIALALVLFAAIGITTKFITTRKDYRKQKVVVTEAMAEETHGMEEKLVPSKDTLCLVESESSGTLDEPELDEMLEMAKIGGSKKVLAMEFAGKIEVMQTVKSCVVIDQNRKARFETTVEINITNNSNRVWTKLAIIAKIPLFLGEHISNISANAKLQATKEGSIIRFSVEKLGAMRSLRISYEVQNLILQEEANSIPLPAVIYYEESEPLVITKVKVQKKDEEPEKVVLSGVEIKTGDRKKRIGKKKVKREKKSKRGKK